MGSVLKITKDVLGKIMSVIKDEIKSRDNKIIATALAHLTIYTEDTKQAGEYYYNSTEKCYYYYNGYSSVKMTIDNITPGRLASNFKQPQVIPNITYNLITPFSNAGTYFQTVTKDFTVGDYTKWILIPKSTLAAGTYKIGTSSSATYYGTFTKASSGFNQPWEVYLPATFTTRSVVVSKG